jgi:hypothetical protein
MSIYSPGQTSYTLSPIEVMTVGSDQEVYEVVGGASVMA